MATPTFKAIGTLTTDAGFPSTSIAIPYYTSPAADDLAFLWMCSYEGTIDDVSGWTGFAQINASAQIRGRLFWKRMSGGESGTVTVGGTSTQVLFGCMMGVLGGSTAATPYEGANTATGSSTSQTSATIVTTGDTLLLRFSTQLGQGGTSTAPGSWTERADADSASGADLYLTVDTQERAASGTEAASTRTVPSGGAYGVQTLAVLVAASGQPYDLHEGGVKFVNQHHGGQNFRFWRKAGELFLPPKRRWLTA